MTERIDTKQTELASREHPNIELIPIKGTDNYVYKLTFPVAERGLLYRDFEVTVFGIASKRYLQPTIETAIENLPRNKFVDNAIDSARNTDVIYVNLNDSQQKSKVDAMTSKKTPKFYVESLEDAGGFLERLGIDQNLREEAIKTGFPYSIQAIQMDRENPIALVERGTGAISSSKRKKVHVFWLEQPLNLPEQ